MVRSSFTAERGGRFDRSGCGCAIITHLTLLFLLFLVLLVIDGVVGPPPNFGPEYTMSNHDTLRFLAARGMSFRIHIQAGSTVDGLWASPDGLRLVLDDPAGSTLVVLPPKAIDWGAQLTLVCKNGNCPTSVSADLPCSLKIPSLPDPINRTIKGHIIGTISYPEDQGGGIFDTNSMPVSVSIQLDLVSASQYAQRVEETNRVVMGAVILLVVSNIPFVLVAWIVARKYRRSEKRRRTATIK